jgi:hypothetical protein
MHQIQNRIDPIPRVETNVSPPYRVYSDKQIVENETLTLYDQNGTISTVITTSQYVDLLI